jgi:hypothetical protein
MREVRRAAHHRDRSSLILDAAAKFRPALAILEIEESGKKLQSVDIDRPGQVNPLME